MDAYPLARRDILTLAGLASISPFALDVAQAQSRTSAQSDARRHELYALMGDLPARTRPISGKKRSEEERDGYVLETWDLDLNGIENVPAYSRARRARPGGCRPSLQPLARRRLQDRQAGIRRRTKLPAAGAVRKS